MIWNPWWQNRLLRERLHSAEQSVERQQRYLQVHYANQIVMHRELSLAHAALRRKNLTLKRLRAQAKEAQLAEVTLRRQETLAMCDQLTSELAAVTQERDDFACRLSEQDAELTRALAQEDESRRQVEHRDTRIAELEAADRADH